jgi:hypothetical protein
VQRADIEIARLLDVLPRCACDRPRQRFATADKLDHRPFALKLPHRPVEGEVTRFSMHFRELLQIFIRLAGVHHLSHPPLPRLPTRDRALAMTRFNSMVYQQNEAMVLRLSQMRAGQQLLLGVAASTDTR